MSLKSKSFRAYIHLKRKKYAIAGGLGVGVLFFLFQNCGSSTSNTTNSAVEQPRTTANTQNTLEITPQALTIGPNETITFSASGGASNNYTFALVSGTGTLTPSGSFIAPNVDEVDEIIVTDSMGNTSSTKIQIATDGSATPTPTPTVEACATYDVTYNSKPLLSQPTQVIHRTLCGGRYVVCGNGTFGDPSPGHTKHCTWTDAGNTYTTTEGSTFTVPGGKGLRFYSDQFDCMCGTKRLKTLNNAGALNSTSSN